MQSWALDGGSNVVAKLERVEHDEARGRGNLGECAAHECDEDVDLETKIGRHQPHPRAARSACREHHLAVFEREDGSAA